MLSVPYRRQEHSDGQIRRIRRLCDYCRPENTGVYSFGVIRLSCSSLGYIRFIATSKSTERNINERWKVDIFQEAKTLTVYTPTARILLFANQLWHSESAFALSISKTWRLSALVAVLFSHSLLLVC